ncbi:MAG: hypothetical protein KAI24_02425, partial [Planctomycetes bacterium]|nr:hypothetical protein [Planctomycetota bacterium]
MNRHIEHAWDRHIDHGLRELHGEAAPDYTDAVLARLGDDQRRAEPSRPRIWPTAAALLGAAIVGILLMLDPGRSPAAARDWFESLRQHRVSTLEQFAALPPDARRLMLSTSDDAVIDTLLGALVRREAEFDRPRLVDLWIGDDAFIDARDLGDLARLPGLERLSIELAPTVDADALRQLAALPKLRTLFLRSCILTSEQLEVLAEFAALDGLRLAFTETEPRSPDSLRFLRRLPKLQLLDV